MSQDSRQSDAEEILERFQVYQTQAWLYVVGFNADSSRYRVLKVRLLFEYQAESRDFQSKGGESKDAVETLLRTRKIELSNAHSLSFTYMFS